jgi:hypothetical protein
MARRVVVEWTRSSLRLAVAAGRAGRWRLRTLASRPLQTADDAVAALRALLANARVAGASVIGVVPREQVITRMVRFPTVHREELSRMVDLYAKSQLPYPPQHSVTDFHLVRQQDGFSTVAIVTCQRHVIETQVVLLRAAGLSASLLTLSSWGVLGWYRLARSGVGRSGRLEGSSDIPEPTLVINLDEARTDLVLLANARLLASRSLGQGTQDWPAADECVELLAVEAERSRIALRKDLPEVEIRSIVLTGVGPLEEWGERLAQRVGLPVTVLPAQSPGWAHAKSLPAAFSSVVLTGLACGELQGALNLNPPEIKLRARHRRQIRELVMVSLLVVAVLALGAGLLAVRGLRQRHLVSQLAHALAELEPQARAVRERMRDLHLLETLLADRRELVELVAGIFRAVPADVHLDTLSFERTRGQLSLRGQAPSTQVALDYVTRLRQLEHVQQADLKYARPRATPAGERTEFEVVIAPQRAG